MSPQDVGKDPIGHNRPEVSPKKEGKDNDHPLRKIKLALEFFWSNFEPCGDNPGQCIGECRSKEFKLQLLQDFSSKSYWFNKREPLYERRKKFKQARRHKNKFRYPCFMCGGKCDQRHHIISLKNGGSNSKKNIVPICSPCHAEIHPWMKGPEESAKGKARWKS